MFCIMLDIYIPEGGYVLHYVRYIYLKGDMVCIMLDIYT